MSFGEIMNLYEDGELVISPDFQRLYRWESYQKSKFIESILLGIPLPPIFVFQDDDNTWELVDGLQRLSTTRLPTALDWGRIENESSSLHPNQK